MEQSGNVVEGDHQCAAENSYANRKNDAANNHNVHCISCTIMEISSHRILITGLE